MNQSIIHPTAWLDQFFRDFDRDYAGRVPAGFLPPVDIVEEREAFLLRVEIPGVSRDKLNVEVKENHLVLSGTKDSNPASDATLYRHFESKQGRFSRTFSLPRNVQTDAIAAEYKDGVLTLRIPKVEESKAKSVEIR